MDAMAERIFSPPSRATALACPASSRASLAFSLVNDAAPASCSMALAVTANDRAWLSVRSESAVLRCSSVCEASSSCDTLPLTCSSVLRMASSVRLKVFAKGERLVLVSRSSVR